MRSVVADRHLLLARTGARTYLLLIAGQHRQRRRKHMTWKTPKIVEVAVGMEINMYACAVRK
jgi:coenzyme PQQ precursor peptide PqqA